MRTVLQQRVIWVSLPQRTHLRRRQSKGRGIAVLDTEDENKRLAS